jgi:hypothetical protein
MRVLRRRQSDDADLATETENQAEGDGDQGTDALATDAPAPAAEDAEQDTATTTEQDTATDELDDLTMPAELFPPVPSAEEEASTGEAERAAQAAAGRPGRRRRGWSLRAHVLLLVIVTVVAMGAACIALTGRDFQQSRDDVAAFGHHQSKLGAAELSDTVPEIRGLMIRSGLSVGIATGGNVAGLPPEKCNLHFVAFREFPTGTLHIVLPDGTVVCSSDNVRSDVPRPYANASWLQPVFANASAAVVGPLVDPVTRRWVLFVSAPIQFNGQTVGALSLGLEAEPVAPSLHKRISGQHRFDVLITDSKAQRIVSWSSRPHKWVGAKLLKSFARADDSRGTRIRDPEGTPRVYTGGGRVNGLGWRVFVGVPVKAMHAEPMKRLESRAFVLGLAMLAISLVALAGLATIRRR